MSERPFSPFERLVAMRYLRSRRDGRGLSLTAWVSLAGLSTGAALLIILMSVMNGMRTQVLSHILGVDAHIRIERADGPLLDTDAMVRRLQTVPDVLQVVPTIEGDVMVVAQGGSAGATLRGLAPGDLAERSPAGQGLLLGRLPGGDDDAEIAMGTDMANGLGVSVGDQVTLVTPDPEGGTQSVPRSRTFHITALYRIDNEKYDAGVVFAPLGTTQRFFAKPGMVSSIDITVSDPAEVTVTKRAVQAALPADLRVRDWRDLNAAFVSALRVEKVITFILLALAVVIVTFNVIVGNAMLVRSKGREIAILRTMGGTRASILRIFFISGASTGCFGTAIGMLIGLAVSGAVETAGRWLIRAREHLPDSAVLDFLSRLPAIIQPLDVFLVVAFTLAASFVAPVYPAWRAARLDPVEALRYE